MSVTVRNNPVFSRYEVYDGDELAGFTEYHLYRDEIAFIHTETDPAFAGRGLAGQLVQKALDDVRIRGLAVLPFCPYVRKFIVRHPEYIDLVPAGQRARFGLDPAQPSERLDRPPVPRGHGCDLAIDVRHFYNGGAVAAGLACIALRSARSPGRTTSCRWSATSNAPLRRPRSYTWHGREAGPGTPRPAAR